MAIILETIPDNKKISNGNIFLTGEYMRNNKDIKANRLFLEADKDLRLSYIIEDAGVFTFKSSTMIGEYINDRKITWSVVKKSSRGHTEIDEASYTENNIGNFCLRPVRGAPLPQDCQGDCYGLPNDEGRPRGTA